MWHKPQAATVRTRYKCHHICQLSVHFPQNKFVPRQRANRWMMWASAHFNGLPPAMFVCAVYLFVLIFILGTFSDSINFKMANNLWFAVNDLWFRFTRAARFSRKFQVGVGWFRWTLFESFSVLMKSSKTFRYILSRVYILGHCHHRHTCSARYSQALHRGLPPSIGQPELAALFE